MICISSCSLDNEGDMMDLQLHQVSANTMAPPAGGVKALQLKSVQHLTLTPSFSIYNTL